MPVLGQAQEDVRWPLVMRAAVCIDRTMTTAASMLRSAKPLQLSSAGPNPGTN